MTYALGVDLGTTYSAAAIMRGERLEIFQLGRQSATIPSVVVLRADGEVLTGEAAERRALTEPTRTAREFKRRLGDPIPIILGGTPFSAEALLARLLEAIVHSVAEQAGAAPGSIVLCHPASYGAYKIDLMRQAVRLADVGDVSLISEPEAAAIHYAIEERVPTGAVVGVYDFGGGTFDATVLRTSAGGFELIGRPEGMERLGGIDFDEAILRHVLDSVRDAGLEPDAGDAGMLPALARLREECRRAKEALSSDTDTTIAVQLPAASMDVRLTRPELEAMIRPRIAETIATLGRAVRSAGLDVGALDRVLLVGGSSRIPLVSEMVREATARPVALDAHPKHTMALGAAYSARHRLTGGQMVAEPVYATSSVTEVGTVRPSPLDAPSGTGRLSRWLGAASVRRRTPILALATTIVLVLVAAGLGLSSLTDQADPTLTPERTQPVASQPHATALARPDSRPVAVPMLVGLREDAVRATLEAAGLVPGLRRGAFHPTTPLGEVIDQSPLAGAELLPGGAVDYTVSAGPRPVAPGASP